MIERFSRFENGGGYESPSRRKPRTEKGESKVGSLFGVLGPRGPIISCVQVYIAVFKELSKVQKLISIKIKDMAI